MATSTDISDAHGGSLRGALGADKYIAWPVYDWIFILLCPLFAIGVVLGSTLLFPKASIEGYVLTYMAVGHHIPTFLRAYGDPAEYNTNRFKLIVIPLLVIPLLFFIFITDSRLFTLIFMWDQYHFIRQHYGLAKIYDAKVGVYESQRYNLDQLLSFAAFIAIITHSDFYSYIYTDTLFGLGLDLPSWLSVLLQQGSLAFLVVLLVLYVLDLQRRFASGQPISVLKLVLFATTYGTWWYAYVLLSDPLLSYSISALFHCTQYDAFAYVYNQKKAKSLDQTRGNLLFRTIHSTRHVWLYILAIFSYGFLSQNLGAAAPGTVYFINRSTGLLHYYFDAFIWRVRRTDFREHL